MQDQLRNILINLHCVVYLIYSENFKMKWDLPDGKKFFFFIILYVDNQILQISPVYKKINETFNPAAFLQKYIFCR